MVQVIFQANIGLGVITMESTVEIINATPTKTYTNKNPIGPETIFVSSGFASPKSNSLFIIQTTGMN